MNKMTVLTINFEQFQTICNEAERNYVVELYGNWLKINSKTGKSDRDAPYLFNELVEKLYLKEIGCNRNYFFTNHSEPWSAQNQTVVSNRWSYFFTVLDLVRQYIGVVKCKGEYLKIREEIEPKL